MGNASTNHSSCSGGELIYEHDNPKEPKVALAASMSSVFILAFVSNITLLCVVLRNSKLRTVPNKLVLNLSVCGLLTVLLNGPFVVVSEIKGNWIFPCWMCDLNGFTTTLYGFAAITTLAVISVNRYQLVRLPNKVKKSWATPRTLPFVISGIWLFSCCLAAPPLFGWSQYEYVPQRAVCTLLWSTDISYTVCIFLLGVVLPFMVILYSYLMIFLTVRKNFRNLNSHRNGPKSTATLDNHSQDFAPFPSWHNSQMKSPPEEDTIRHDPFFHRRRNKVYPRADVSFITPSYIDDLLCDSSKPHVPSDQNRENVKSVQRSISHPDATISGDGKSPKNECLTAMEKIFLLRIQRERITGISPMKMRRNTSPVNENSSRIGATNSSSNTEVKTRKTRKTKSKRRHGKRRKSRMSVTPFVETWVDRTCGAKCTRVSVDSGVDTTQMGREINGNVHTLLCRKSLPAIRNEVLFDARGKMERSKSLIGPLEDNNGCGLDLRKSPKRNFCRSFSSGISTDNSNGTVESSCEASAATNSLSRVVRSNDIGVTNCIDKNDIPTEDTGNGQSTATMDVTHPNHTKPQEIRITPAEKRKHGKEEASLVNQNSESTKDTLEELSISGSSSDYPRPLSKGGDSGRSLTKCSDINSDHNFIATAIVQNEFDGGSARTNNSEGTEDTSKESRSRSSSGYQGSSSKIPNSSGSLTKTSNANYDANPVATAIVQNELQNGGSTTRTNVVSRFCSDSGRRFFRHTFSSSVRRVTTSNLTDEMRITIILLIILASFMMCWAPITIVNFIETVSSEGVSDAMNTFSVFMMFLSSLVNPLTYGLLNRNFRKELSAMTGCLKCNIDLGARRGGSENIAPQLKKAGTIQA